MLLKRMKSSIIVGNYTTSSGGGEKRKFAKICRNDFAGISKMLPIFTNVCYWEVKIKKTDAFN